MGIKRARTALTNENVEKLSVPPGFVSLTSFRLKKAETTEQTCVGASSGEPIQTGLSSGLIDAATIKRSFWYRPWMLPNHNYCDQEDSDSEQVDMELPLRTRLPKGVVRGCPDCCNCLKVDPLINIFIAICLDRLLLNCETLPYISNVFIALSEQVTARWRPEDSRKHIFEEAPVFHPTEEEFQDTLKYIESIRLKAEGYGICRIVPPSSWKPPCLIKEKNIWEGPMFTAKIQQIDGLNQYMEGRMPKVSENVKVCQKRGKYQKGLEYEVAKGCITDHDDVGCSDVEGFESEPGPEFSIETFMQYANNFKDQYFLAGSKAVGQKQWEPSLEDIVGEYSRIVENPTEEIEVLYGDKLDRGVFGSGFPIRSNASKVSENHEYVNSGWNLNNTPKLTGSLLSFESSKTSVVITPQLKLGMCFSSFNWKVEEHHLYSLCYIHLGAPKVWYGIPGRYTVKFETTMKKYLPDSSVEQPKLRDNLIIKLSPSTIKSESIPVYRCVQYPGEFVLVFPGAYFSGFDCGFNCAESVNVAPFQWLPHGQNVVELYSAQRRKTSISHDKLLLSAAREAVRAQWEISLLRKDSLDYLRWTDGCGKDGILTKALKSRIKLEANRREYLCPASQSQIMDKNFDAIGKRECSVCFYDLHLSAARCSCSANKYSCLNHAKLLCSCAWNEKKFLFRYDISELNILMDALEGKLIAVCKWAREDLKLTLHSRPSENNEIKSVGSPESCEEKSEGKGHKPQLSASLHGSGRTISSIREEIKARLLKARSHDELVSKKNATASTVHARTAPDDARPTLIPEFLSDGTTSSSSSDSGLSDTYIRLLKNGFVRSSATDHSEKEVTSS